MKQTLLAIDVGGTNSRAFVVDAEGTVLGRGRGKGGNPASNTPEQGAAAIIAAVEAAVAEAGPSEIGIALMALAGPEAHIARGRLEEAFARLGLVGKFVVVGDLLAMFASMTPRQDGYCIVAGTGAGAIRVRDGRIDRVADAAGWLLGDKGSGYWLGHQAARAATADLDGRGEATALTPALLNALGIEVSAERVRYGRSAHLQRFTDQIYAMRPIELARFAPLVFEHRDDAIAAELIAAAEKKLTHDFATVYDPEMPGPVAFGGGVVKQYRELPRLVTEVIEAAGHRAELHVVTDGSVGAIVMALRAHGIAVDDAKFAAITASLAA